jgi:hypothetical protein
MNYQEADAKLQGRCYQSRKLENNTYLKRRNWGSTKAIAVRLHTTDVITFFEDGRIEVSTGGWDTVTTRDRISSYLPKPWTVYGERNATILSNFRWYAPRGDWSKAQRKGSVEVVLNNSATISQEQTVEGGKDVAAFRKEIREQDNERNRVRSRARYWVRKARGVFVDRSQCHGGRRGFRQTGVWQSCNTTGRWNRRNLQIGEYKCGCRVSLKTPTYHGTVESILQEENVTVRVAKMTCYGIERFFLDANAKILDDKAGYQLLSLPFDRWNEMKALKMTCPSTGAVYVNAVPPTMNEVPAALDWMFNTENYLETVTQQS